MQGGRGWIALPLLLLLSPGEPAADPAPQPWSSWLAEETATGTWGGLRDSLEKSGVTPALSYTTDLLANPVGGLAQSSAYAGEMYGSLTFDLETLAGIPGLTLYMAGAWDTGRNLSDDIGNVFPVAEVFQGDGIQLAQVYLQQSLWGGLAQATIGRLATGDVFADADSYEYYVSAAVNSNPSSILLNVPHFTTPPFAQWGVTATLQPTPEIYLSAGAYDASRDDRFDGTDFGFHLDQGILAVGEVGYRADRDGQVQSRLSLGGYYDSGDFTNLASGLQQDGNYGLYIIAEQRLYSEPGPNSDQGLTGWATVTLAPDQTLNPLPYAAFGGLYWQGLLPGHDQDVTALALYYGSFSRDLPGQDFELVLEANHRFQLAPWLYVTPDFQYVFNPGGLRDAADAAVFGAEIGIDF